MLLDAREKVQLGYKVRVVQLGFEGQTGSFLVYKANKYILDRGKSMTKFHTGVKAHCIF